MTKKDAWVLVAFAAAFAAVAAWGYASGGLEKLSRTHTPTEKAAAEQRALDRLFGGDTAFDPSAENVTAAAGGSQDSVSWKTLARARIKYTAHNTVPVIDYGDVKRLEGQKILITGYIFPLQGSGDQTHFILSAYPPSCPYCLPGGPTDLIEVTDSKPIPFTYKPVTLEGKLQLLSKPEDLATGMLYRMTGVELRKK